MQEMSNVWDVLNRVICNPKGFWTPEELEENPTITDRVIHYLISYFDQPNTARQAIRYFLGIDCVFGDVPSYSCWDEVRVATLGDIDATLKTAGCQGETWEIAVTIKDFLQNAFDTLETVHFDDLQDDHKPGEITAYFRQLRGYADAWRRGQSSPFRPDTSPFFKHCKRYRRNNEGAIPENVIHYLEFLWGRVNTAPFDYHTDKIFSRLGLFSESDSQVVKTAKFNVLVGEEKQFGKHKQLVQFSKTICRETPRCDICPLASSCAFMANKSAATVLA